MIEFNCPVCGRQIRIAEQHSGKTGRCKECGERIRIPEPPKPDIPPKPVELIVKEAFEKFKSSDLAQSWKKNCEKYPETPFQVGCLSFFIAVVLINMLFQSEKPVNNRLEPIPSSYYPNAGSPSLKDAEKTIQRYEDMEKARSLYNSLGDLPPGPEQNRRGREVEDILRRNFSD